MDLNYPHLRNIPSTSVLPECRIVTHLSIFSNKFRIWLYLPVVFNDAIEESTNYVSIAAHPFCVCAMRGKSDMYGICYMKYKSLSPTSRMRCSSCSTALCSFPWNVADMCFFLYWPSFCNALWWSCVTPFSIRSHKSCDNMLNNVSEWRFYALSTSQAIFRVRTYRHNLFSLVINESNLPRIQGIPWI